MTDSSEFKHLVRQRMDATGEKYTDAYRALLDEARGAVVPSKHLILPRISARYLDRPAKPEAVVLYPFRSISLELDDSELQQYLAADQTGRDDLVREWLVDRIEWLLEDESLIAEHEIVYEDQAEDETVRQEASYLGITPDQYAWLEERLTEEEFSQLSDAAMHSLLTNEYTEYSNQAGQETSGASV